MELEIVCEALKEVAAAFGGLFAEISKQVAVVAAGITHLASEATRWHVAYEWASKTHPQWVKIMQRTKKRRVWKKYHNRILREYERSKSNA